VSEKAKSKDRRSCEASPAEKFRAAINHAAATTSIETEFNQRKKKLYNIFCHDIHTHTGKPHSQPMAMRTRLWVSVLRAGRTFNGDKRKRILKNKGKSCTFAKMKKTKFSATSM